MSAGDELFPPDDAGLAEAVRLQRDLYLYWEGAARMESVALTTRGLVARPALRRLLEPLGSDSGDDDESEISPDAPESERPRAFFLRRALERLGLLRVTGESDARRIQAAETRIMARYLARALSERIELLARLWSTGGWWPDHPERGETLASLQAAAPPPIARARRRALDALASAIPGSAIALTAPSPALERLHGAGLAGRSSARHRKGQPQRPAARQQRATARQAGGDDSLVAALAGPLTWLGLARWEGERAAWVAGLPALALRGAASATLQEAHGRVVAQSNLTLIAYAPFSAPELFTLDLCATRESLEQAARYQLSRQSFAHARATGWDAAQTAARLERLTAAPLPGPLRTALSDWERAASRLRLTESATLLEVPTAQTLDALLADRAGSAWVLRRLTPTAALIYPDDVSHVRAWLLRRGHLPATVEGANTP